MNIKFFVAAYNPAQQIVSTDEDVSLNLNVINPCGDDELAFMTPIDSFTYFITAVPVGVAKDPTLTQKLPQCLKECELIQESDNAIDLEYSLNVQTGEMLFLSSRLDIHQQTYDVTLNCQSFDNAYLISDPFSITYVDACAVTEFVFPSFSTVEVDLYSTTITPIPIATTVAAGCTGVSYTVETIIPQPGFDGAIPPMDIDNNGGSPNLIITPLTPNNLGDYAVSVKACVLIQVTNTLNCQIFESIPVTVVDPCLKTQVMVSNI